MIRKLTEMDRVQALDFLSEEPAINLFMIGDIEQFGFEADFQELWGSFDRANHLRGILLRYNESYIPYYKDFDFDTTGFKEIIKGDSKAEIISGKESLLVHFKDVFPKQQEHYTYFCELKTNEYLKSYPSTIRLAQMEDVDRICELLEEIEEFSHSSTTAKQIAHTIKTKSGRFYYLEDENGQMMNVVQTTAENSKSAMVVGVATRKAFRKQGLMSSCLSKLCSDLLAEGKTLCLFYDNPEAGKIYHRLGFESIDKWTMFVNQK